MVYGGEQRPNAKTLTQFLGGQATGESSRREQFTPHLALSIPSSTLTLVTTSLLRAEHSYTTARMPQAVATGFTFVILFTPQHGKEQALPSCALAAKTNEAHTERLATRQGHTITKWQSALTPTQASCVTTSNTPPPRTTWFF